MSVPFRTVSGFRRFFSPACAVPRLRILYYSALAILAITLLGAHRLLLREHREARLLAAATHVCQIQAALPVVFVRVSPAAVWAGTKTKFDIHHAAAAAAPKKEK
jgi:hypothetical protein